MNRGVPFGTALRAFSRAVGHGERRPIVDAGEGRPELPDSDSSTLSGWLQNFGSRFRNTSDVPHESPTYNPGMERYATESLYSEDALYSPDMTREDWQQMWAETRSWGGAILFGPERESIVPGRDEARRGERFLRDWGLSEQEFRLSGEAFSEGRVGAGLGWGALAIGAAVPFAGDAARGVGASVRAGKRAVSEAGEAVGTAAARREIPAGAWSSNPYAEELPLDFVRRFTEHDRAARPLGTNIDDVADQIAARGFDDAIVIEVDPLGRARILEGNHRVAAAERLGLDSVPVRVITSSEGRLSQSGATVGVREGLGSGKLLKPSEVFSDFPAPAAGSGVGRERLASSRRFDADEAMYYSDDFDYLRLASDEVPETAYHVAPRSARDSIDQRGLDPDSSTWNTGAGQNQEWWDDAIWERLGDAGEMIPIEYRPEGIYLFGDLAEAQRYARGGGDIYEVDVRRILDDGGDFIRDPSVAPNWEFLDPSEFTYVTRVAPEGYFRRIDEVPGTGLDDMIRAERSRIRNILAPEEQLSSGVVVPRYGDTAVARQAFDEFLSMQPVIPQMQRLNRQWMDVADDTLMHYQVHLLGPQAQIVDELAALAHWQYVGNNNIQALLRTGRMPVHDAYEQAVLDLMGMHQVPRSQIEAVFTTRAQEAMPLLDNLIATSSTHGGFVAYRGVDRASLNAAFGDDFYIALATDPRSLVGRTWTDSAYSATSLDPVRAREFALGERPNPETMGVLFRVSVPNGVGAAPVNGYLNPYSPRFQNEFEMLIGRDTTFRITEVVTPMDQSELINPKWFNTFWDEASGTYAHLRTDTIPVVHIEVVP